VELYTQKEMDKSTNKSSKYFNGFKRILKGIWLLALTILAACMIGFSNAYYDENRTVKDFRNKFQQEQVFDDEDKTK
jgi:hypothetical protein